MFGRGKVVLVLLMLLAGSARAAVPEIGTTITVKNQVTIELEATKRKLGKGDKVHQNEIVETAKSASTEIGLNDETKLAVGPNARLVLDRFVYDADGAAGAVTVNLVKGAFRFVSGKSGSSAYEIKTPTASIGVRGTVFDIYVAPNGEMALLLHEGAVDVCPTPASCRRHDGLGRLLHVNPQGLLSAPLRWDGSIMGGLAVGAAFPFVGRRLAIDPVRRLRHADLIRGSAALGTATRAVTKPVEEIGKTPGRVLRSLPTPRLPF